MRLANTLLPGTGPARRHLVLAVSLGALAAVVLVAQALLFGDTVDAVFLRGHTLRDAALPLAWLGALAVLRAWLGGAGEVAAARASAETRAAVRIRLVDALVARGPLGLGKERTGELANTLVGGVDRLDAYVRHYLPQLVLAVIVPAIIGIAVAVIDPLSALVLAVTWPLIPLFMHLIGGHARVRTRRQWIALSRLSARFLEALQGLVTLKAFGRSEAEAEAIAEASDRFRQLTLSVLKVAFLSALVLEMLATISTAIVAVEVGLRLLYDRMAFASALTVLLLTPEFYRPLRALGASFHAGMEGRESGQRIAELLGDDGSHPTPASAAGPELDTVAPPAPPFHVRFEAVTVAYPGRPAPALEGLTLDLRPGTTVALVGPTGAGKTTVTRLLLRFLEPDAGRIVVNGRPLSDLAADAWRRQVAWVQQRPNLFHGTLRENLLHARPDASEEDLGRALRQAHADGLVAELPHGLETALGEGAARLSGGQAQRVALARAFLKDAALVVLDEPTAQLDPEHEALVSDAIVRLRAGRTVLLVAHRLATVVGADQIVLLDAGRIVEQGTHRALVDAGGAYARLVAAFGGLP